MAHQLWQGRLLAARIGADVVRIEAATAKDAAMGKTKHNHVFLSFAQANLDFVEALAQRLQGDARLSFWFAPWHSIPGEPIQEQMEEAL